MSKPIILNIAAWWPTDNKPGNGLFIKDHILSTKQERPIVIFLRSETVRFGKPVIQVERKTGQIDEYLVRVRTPIRRFGILESLITKGYEKAVFQVSKDHGRIDLIHFHVRDHISKYGIDLVDSLGIPHVLTEHFSYYHRGIHLLDDKDKSREVKKISSWFESQNLRQIITVSEEMKTILSSDYRAAPGKIHVIPNIASSDFRYASKLADEYTRIALVAGWRPPKNPLLFFGCLTSMPAEERANVQIDFVGHGEQLDQVRAYVEKNLTEMKINIHGYKPKDEVATILQRADFLVHPTDQENLPTIIAESLSCGTPVLSMDVNGIPEMIDESNGILVPAKDGQALLEGLREMMLKKSDFNCEEIAHRASNKYSASSVGPQIDAILKLALNE